MWPLIFHMFMTSLILFQLAMIVCLPPSPRSNKRGRPRADLVEHVAHPFAH